MPIPENIQSFEKTMMEEYPPESWPEALKAIWWDFKNDWERSHSIAQEINSGTGNWIHAYLHRKEGDRWNAGYWYSRAGKEYPNITLDQERKNILKFLLGNQGMV